MLPVLLVIAPVMGASKLLQLVKIVLSTSSLREVGQLVLHVFWGLSLPRETLLAHLVMSLVMDALVQSQLAITVT